MFLFYHYDDHIILVTMQLFYGSATAIVTVTVTVTVITKGLHVR